MDNIQVNEVRLIESVAGRDAIVMMIGAEPTVVPWISAADKLRDGDNFKVIGPMEPSGGNV